MIILCNYLYQLKNIKISYFLSLIGEKIPRFPEYNMRIFDRQQDERKIMVSSEKNSGKHWVTKKAARKIMGYNEGNKENIR